MLTVNAELTSTTNNQKIVDGTPFAHWYVVLGAGEGIHIHEGDLVAIRREPTTPWAQVRIVQYLQQAHTEAIAENNHRATHAPVVNPLTAEQDTQAALRQAEILGATADQRRKLRTMVEERQAAQAEAARLAAQVEEMSRINANLLNEREQFRIAAEEPILDPSDKRVWDIFGRAAAEADEQGYCSVYDNISTNVGIPDRDALREAGYLGGAKKDYVFRVSVVVEFNVYRSDLTEEQAENLQENPDELFGSLSDLDRDVRNNVDVNEWSAVTIDDYNEQ